MTEKKKNVFVADDGTEIKIKKINEMKLRKLGLSVRKRFLAKGEPLDPPSYEVVTVGGGKQTHQHTKKSIFDPETKKYRESLDEMTIAAWEAYQDAEARYFNEVGESSLGIILRDGTAFDLPKDDGWAELHELDGIEVPTHPEARRAHYLMTELLSIQQQRELANLIMAQSRNQITEQIEEAAEVAESFRGEMEVKEGAETK